MSAARTVRTIADQLETHARELEGSTRGALAGSVPGELRRLARQLDDARAELAHAASKLHRARALLDPDALAATGADGIEVARYRIEFALAKVADQAASPEELEAEADRAAWQARQRAARPEPCPPCSSLCPLCTGADIDATCDGCDATWPASSATAEREHEEGCTDPESGAAQSLEELEAEETPAPWGWGARR